MVYGFSCKSTARVLLQFFCDRLKDAPSVPPAFRGCLSLLQAGKVDGEGAVQLSKTYVPKRYRLLENEDRIFAELSLQTFIQTTRLLAFRCFLLMVQQHALYLKDQLGEEFLKGYIHAMDGEKDPRNLMMAFKLVQMLATRFPLHSVAEELYEVYSCYFPVTFRPPPNDLIQITPDDLKSGLKACFSASALFAPYALPLLMEKLSSTAPAAKHDAMNVLAAVCPVYGVLAFQPHLEDIWIQIQSLMFDGTESHAFEQDVTELLAALIETLASSGTGITVSQEVGENKDILSSFVDHILQRLKFYWTPLDGSLHYKTAVLLLASLCKAHRKWI